MSEIMLNRCPFCGGRAAEMSAEYKYFFECTVCESRGPKALTLGDAKKLWNNRVTSSDYKEKKPNSVCTEEMKQ